MRRPVALPLVALALALPSGTGSARAADFSVVVVPGLRLSDLAGLQTRGAVGLLVPGSGRRTSERLARASLERGKVANSARGTPSGPILVPVTTGPVPDRGNTIVLGLPPDGTQANDRRYPIAVLGGGYQGVLTSDSTRLHGLVSVDDVAPTALGRPGALGWEPRSDAAATVLALDRTIREHRRTKVPAMLLTVGLTALLALVFPRAGLLGFGAALVTSLALGAAGATDPWIVLPAIAIGIGAGAPAAALVIRGVAGLGAALAVVPALYLAAFVVDETWVALSPLGPSQNGRYYGLSNLLATLLLVPSLAGAALVGRRYGAPGLAAVAALSFATVAGSRFGADGGGAIVLAVGYAVLVVGLTGAPRRALAVAVPAAAALVLSFVAIDAATGASSHVTDAWQSGPWGLAGDLADRAALSYHNAVAAWYTALPVAASLAGLALLAADAFRRALDNDDRALLAAFLAAAGTSLVVNDSPLDVALVGLTGFWALARFARGRSPVRPAGS